MKRKRSYVVKRTLIKLLCDVAAVTAVACALSVCGCKTDDVTKTNAPADRETNSDATNVSVVVFGMEKSSAGNCPGSKLDARRFAELMQKIGYGNVRLFLNERGTIFNFEYSVSEALAKSDLTIVYYSGHGGSDTPHNLGTGENEDDGIDEFLCLYDGYYVDDRIWNLVSESNGRVMLIFDCCHSQTMFRSPPMEKFIDLAAADVDGAESPRLLCWSGCPDDTYSYGSNEGGFFTSTILKYWRSGMSYEQLWRFVSSDINLKKAQRCQQTVIGDWNLANEAFK